MKTAVLALAAVAMGFVANSAAAQESPWLVRVRAVNIEPVNKSDAFSDGIAGSDAISVSNKTIPELDISYFFTPNIAAELILTYPQKLDVSVDGLGQIGTFKALPPTLTAQYHFLPTNSIDPYVGAGINYTNISSQNLLGGVVTLEHKSFGGALQAGVDFKIDKNWSINLDLKKVWISSDVYIEGTKVSNAQLNPLLVGAGVGYRF